MNSSVTRSFRAISIALLGYINSHAIAAAYDQMVVFGDSLSDNGNFSLALGPGVLSSLNYDSMRLTDGPGTTPATSITGVTVEQLNQALGLPMLAPALVGGNNYAWARATTDFNAPDPASGITPGTGTQIAAYLSTHLSASPDSLYVLWAGANDLFNATTTAGIQAAEISAITHLNLQIATLLSAGAKNLLWFNLPDLSLTPAGALEGSALGQQLHLSSLQFQQEWAASLHNFQTLFPDANLVGVDAFSILTAMVSQPSTYGFSNVTDPARGQAGIDPDQYLFWDTLHPTTKADSVLAGIALQDLKASAVPEPSTGAYVGLLVLGLLARRWWMLKNKSLHS